jgi:hypothetical protein
VFRACEQGPVRETNPISRSPEWIAARDALNRHSVSSCPGCHPRADTVRPVGRCCRNTWSNSNDQYAGATRVRVFPKVFPSIRRPCEVDRCNDAGVVAA